MHLYERIYEDLKRSVEEGEVGPGERLPSIRELASRYACNKLTVQKAYEFLAVEGIVENRVGSGSYVRRPGPAEEGRGEFAHAALSEDFFPYEEAGELLAAVLKAERGRVFSSPDPRGEPALLQALARRYDLPAERLVVTSGAGQALDLVHRLLESRGGFAAAVEEPGYPGTVTLFRPRAALPLDDEGVEAAALEAFFRVGAPGAAGMLFACAPELHNPTGLRYSAARKGTVSALARASGALLVEDDYLSELLPDRGPRLVDLAPERTIWIKSLSKTTAPGIRIGLLCAPGELVEPLVRLKAESDPGPATWLQHFARNLLESGLHARHIARIASIAAGRRRELLALLARMPGLEAAPSEGFDLWVRCPAPPRLESPPWAEGHRFGRTPSTRAAFRLSFMAPGPEAWAGALGRLGRAMEGLAGKGYTPPR